MNAINKKTNSKKKQVILVILAFIFLVGILATLRINHVRIAQKTNGQIASTKPSSEESVSSSNKNTSGNNEAASSPQDSSKSAPNTDANGILFTPFGNFVSNHSPGKDGSPTTEQSVCNTTPAAFCDIEFKNNSGIIKTLGKKQTDSNGSAYWSWDIKGSELAPGLWQITAVATQNGSTKTTIDSVKLEVQP